MCHSPLKERTISLFSFSFVRRSILTEAKSVSLNATAAFKAYSNIKANVDAAEKEARAAKQRASEALDLVSGRLTNQKKLLLIFYNIMIHYNIYNYKMRNHRHINQYAMHAAFRYCVNSKHHLSQLWKCVLNTGVLRLVFVCFACTGFN